jgi:hypothetical protein
MDQKEVRVACPCCESRLEIDVRTSKIVRWSRKEELDETGKPKLGEQDWKVAAGRVSDRSSSALDRFDASLSREKNRSKDLDELYRKAQEKARGGEEPS